MSKWISDAYIKMLMQTDRLLQGNCEYKLWEQEVEKIVDAMPSINIVRCKECRYKDMELCAMYKLVVAGVRKYDDFCSYGEREGE